MATGGENAKPTGGVGVSSIITLTISGLALLAVYIFLVPEGSSALYSIRRTPKGATSRLDMHPSMSELESLSFSNSDGSRQEVSVLDECSRKNLGDSFRKIFGITPDKITSVTRERPEAFCRSVFQRWYIEGSDPLSAYPISWLGMIKAMERVGLKVVAKQVKTALK